MNSTAWLFYRVLDANIEEFINAYVSTQSARRYIYNQLAGIVIRVYGLGCG